MLFGKNCALRNFSQTTYITCAAKPNGHSARENEDLRKNTMTEHQGVPYHQLNPTYRSMRETSPILYNEQYRMWQIFRYNNIQQMLLDPATFTSQGVGGGLLGAGLVGMDPPRHRQLRALVSQAFTPRRIRELESRIESVVQSLLDAVVDQGRMDLIADLAYPLPALIIAELLGIPLEDRDQFKHWSDAVMREMDVRLADQEKSAHTALTQYLYKQLERRRQEPGNDLVSGLIAAEVDGEKLSDADIMANCALLLIAGHETTTNLIGNAFLCFMKHPEALEDLRADPTLIPSTIEEVLRYWSPVPSTVRIVKTDTEWNDASLKAGQFVVGVLASANRDETVFANPDTFDIRRTPNRHLTFGHGIHFCLGAPLARLESAVVLRVMLERFSTIQLFPETLLEPLPSVAVQGVKHLPIAFTARS
jgi:cytochrome P450